MDVFFNGPVEGLQVYIWVAAITLGVFAHLLRVKERTPAAVVETALVLGLTIIGLLGLTSGLIHLVWSEQIAASIGWPVSPFQTEVAFANLALGAVAAGVIFSRTWIAPAILGKTIFAWGAAVTHVMSWAAEGNLAQNNAGPILWWDIFMPVTLIVLLVLHRRMGVTGAI